MKRINRNVFSLFDKFLIVGVIVSSLLYSYFTKEFDTLGFIAGIAGVICVVLVAKGNIMNYAFGLINVTLYAYISYRANLWGDAVLNALYYLPMQFIGFFSWKKRKLSEDSTKVKAYKMTPKQLMILVAACVVSVAICGFILQKLDDPQPYKDSATTVLSIIAQYLMVKAFAEQWYLWIITNIISVAMWTTLAVHGESQAVMMVIMWIFYLANSINGFIHWRKMAGGTRQIE